jgi:hypothetical protein
VDSDYPICVACGVQYDAAGFDTEHPERERCKICEDERQYVSWGGQQWTSLATLAERGQRLDIHEELPGLWGIGTEQPFGINQRALLVPGERGNVLWDCVDYIDQDGVDRVAELGGLAAIAISHPHFHSTMVEWSNAFGGVPIYVHERDREWLTRSEGAANVELWSGETEEILPGRTLINGGVHFAGGTVMHWAAGAGGRGALCSGDIVQVVMDRRWVSFMYSYPNLIPEHPDVIRRLVEMLRPWDFAQIYGAWWGRVVFADGAAVVRRSAERYLGHIGMSL